MKRKKAKKDWLDNATLYMETKQCGSCPKCGSDAVSAQIMEHGHTFGLWLLCGCCGNWAHFDGRLPELKEPEE